MPCLIWSQLFAFIPIWTFFIFFKLFQDNSSDTKLKVLLMIKTSKFHAIFFIQLQDYICNENGEVRKQKQDIPRRILPILWVLCRIHHCWYSSIFLWGRDCELLGVCWWNSRKIFYFWCPYLYPRTMTTGTNTQIPPFVLSCVRKKLMGG